ncbi:esterase B1-like [Ctenocephalides felis]|uniref:esterase B1-like n=1 Tax=Ctenocephalides felis TaxID=7515 RepID=UPI000E6E4A6A|nr:esterase B1-like [Ctenocephalides felis]
MFVDTANGTVQGQLTVSCTGVDYYSFKGIRYAETPVGSLRFQDPVELVSPTKNLQCVPALPCSQQETLSKRYVGSEDCLTLNIYTKEIKPSTRLCPVMVYIFGGGFMRGTSSSDLYGPDYLVANNVVVVTFNYRLGAFGFLSFSDPELNVPGNAGMKDQVLVLKWVKKNIHHFGGDSNNVTLFGESAGACSVHMHMLSPMSEGLFHKAIAQSGSAFNHRSVSDPKRSLLLAERFGWTHELGQKEALNILLEADAKQIVQRQETLLTPQERRTYVLFPFGPVVEPYENEQCFLPAHPLELATKRKKGWGWGLGMPFITGITSHEALLLYKETMNNPTILSSLGDFTCLLPQELNLNVQEALTKELANNIKKHYFSNSEPNIENIDMYIKLLSDKLFVHAAIRTARSHDGPVYLYRFAVDAKNNVFKAVMCGNVPGTCHADDVQYLFKPKHAKCYESGTVERNTSEFLASAWTTFALLGRPYDSELQTAHWPLYSENEAYVDITNNSVDIKYMLQKDDINFWDDLYSRSNKITSR